MSSSATSCEHHRATLAIPVSRRRLGLTAAALLCLGSLSAYALTEYEVKAAFLFNFAKFVEWPPRAFPEASSPIIFGILGDDPFGAGLPAALERETVKGRSIRIEHYQPGDNFAGCHLLFVSRSAAGQAKEILDRTKGSNVLTVSETETFVAEGGMINFVLVDKSVRFDINPKAVANAGLKVSSKLLAVAHAVKE
jgi:hypothetical protein